MKRMIPQALIMWVKSMAGQIGYSNTYRATEIKGNLKATGSIQSGNVVYTDEIARYGSNTQYKIEFNYDSIVLYANGDALTVNGSGVTLGKSTTVNGNLSIASNRTFKIGSTSLSEDQLKKLIALIPSE